MAVIASFSLFSLSFQRSFRRVALAAVCVLIGEQAVAQTIQGTATYHERIAMPPGAVLEVGGNQTAPTSAQGSRPLEGTCWRATEVAGTPIPAHDPNREAHLLFEAGGRFSGSDACNRITGTHQLKGDVVTFDAGTATQKACIDVGNLGKRLAVFTARNQAPSPGVALGGTSWQLVKFQGSDEKTLTPDDRAKYTIEFAAGGALTARIDCNRGRGTWTSSGSNQIRFGPLALTRAQCPAGSLHDQIVKQWPNIRSYVITDGHLFLSVMADGGIYEFEPIRR